MYYDDVTFLEYAAILGAKLLPIIIIVLFIAGIIAGIDRKAEKEQEKRQQKRAAAARREKELAEARKKMFEMLKGI